MDKDRMIKYGKNAILVVLLLVSVVGLNIAVQKNTSISNQEKQASQQKVKLNVALVNEDNTVTVKGQEYNLGSSYTKNIERNTDHNWSTVSRGTADKGLKEGDYQLVLTIPSDFSTKILDINNTNVDKATITYKVNANGNLQVENEANKVAKDIISDLQSQLVDLYMASILGNLYQAQRNVQILSDTKVTNIEAFRNNLYQPAVNFQTLFPNLVTTAGTTLTANDSLRQALGGNATVYDSLNTAQTTVKNNLLTLIEQRGQGKLSQEDFTASLLAMNSSVLNAETEELFAVMKASQAELTAQIGGEKLDETTSLVEGTGYAKLLLDLEQNIAELKKAVELERGKLAEQEAAIASFAEKHLTDYYGEELETITIEKVLAKSTTLPTSLDAYQGQMEQAIQQQLAQLPSLDPTTLATYLDKLEAQTEAGIQFDSQLANRLVGQKFVPSNDATTLEGLAKELDKHIQAEATFQAPASQVKARLGLLVPEGMTLESWVLNGVVYPADTLEAEVELKESNSLTVNLAYEKTQITTKLTVDDKETEEETAATGTETTTQTGQAAVGIAINGVAVTGADFDWDAYRKGQEAYRKAEAAYAAKVAEVVSKYQQANTLLNAYYPINATTGQRESLVAGFFQQDAKPLLITLLSDAIAANLKSYSELVGHEQSLNDQLTALEAKKEPLKEQLQAISTTNTNLAQQISNQLTFLDNLKARMQTVAEGREQETALQGKYDTDLAALSSELEASLAITTNVKNLSTQNIEEATNVNAIFTNFNKDVQSAQSSGEQLSSEAQSLMNRFEKELSDNGDFVTTFTSVLNNAYNNGVPNEVLLAFLSDPLTESASSVRATVNTYRPFTWILLLEMVALFTAYIFASHRVTKAVKDRFKVNKLEDTDVVTVLVLTLLAIVVGSLIGVVSSQQLAIDSELIPTWVLMMTLFSLLLVQGQYLLIKNAKGLGMGLSFFMVISFIYLSNAIGTTASLTGIPAVLKAMNPLSILEGSLSGYFDGETAGVTTIVTTMVLGLGLALANAFFDMEKLLVKKED